MTVGYIKSNTAPLYESKTGSKNGWNSFGEIRFGFSTMMGLGVRVVRTAPVTHASSVPAKQKKSRKKADPK
jgi:hypothetical protein